MSYLDLKSYKEIFSCVSQYTTLQERWVNLLNDQQIVIEKLDDMGCEKELKDFLMRKQRLEYDQHIISSKSPIHSYCKHSIEYMNTKEQMITQLKNVKKCEDLTKILIQYSIPISS